jgi:3-oxoacyl-[acyl-carrier-protein] synthase II
MLTPYGRGSDACWHGIHDKVSTIKKFSRFDTASLQSDCAAIIEGLVYHQGESLVMQMIDVLFAGMRHTVPEDAKLLVATTKGEIDLLEKMILDGSGDEQKFDAAGLLGKVSGRVGVRDPGMIISTACASASSAVARAALMISGGRADCILVVACDSITEFVFSGFSSLMALDKTVSRPFDRGRSGLSLGEAAAYALIMSRERALREDREIIAEISGWGLSDDANHMTGPSRTSEGMILALERALNSAGCSSEDISFISAHGTGTIYNDQMEMRAYRSVFANESVPVYSIKGALGHTLGAAGLVEMIIAARALREHQVPPTVNLKDVDADAIGWASTDAQAICKGRKALVVNAGFSGINTALVLS